MKECGSGKQQEVRTSHQATAQGKNPSIEKREADEANRSASPLAPPRDCKAEQHAAGKKQQRHQLVRFWTHRLSATKHESHEQQEYSHPKNSGNPAQCGSWLHWKIPSDLRLEGSFDTPT